MKVVVDASAVAASILEDEIFEHAEALLMLIGEGNAIATSIFWDEIRNVLLQNERRGRLSVGETEELLRDLRVSAPMISNQAGDDAVIALARKYDLSAYDAIYGVTAQKHHAPLATLDKRLIAAGEAGAFTLWAPGP